jgi:hypothetical protein
VPSFTVLKQAAQNKKGLQRNLGTGENEDQAKYFSEIREFYQPQVDRGPLRLGLVDTADTMFVQDQNLP